MAKLKYKTDTYNVVNYNDLNEFVEEVTGLPWNLARAYDTFNGSYMIVEVDGESELDYEEDNYQEQLDEWLMSEAPPVRDWTAHREFLENGPSVGLILHELFMREVIPAGIYLILVDW